VLRSVSAFEVYRKVYSNVNHAGRVAELLILREDMPRSLANCVNEVVTNLASVRNDHSRETSGARAYCRPTCTTAASTQSSSRACTRGSSISSSA